MTRDRARSGGRLLAVALLATVFVACGKRAGDDDAAHAAEAPPAVAARTVVVATQPFTETVGALGSVVARAGHVAALSAPAPTRVARIYVTAGAHVVRGAPLVALDQTVFEATARSAEAALAAAERAYERAERLTEAGIAPRKELDAAATELAQARANRVTAERARELAVLRAPLAGVVTRMSAVLGATADPSQPLVEVADPAALDVVLGVTPNEAARVRAGAAVELRAGARATGEPLGVGRVADVGGVVDSASRSVSVRVALPAARRPLRIGETIYGEITVAVHPDALTVPDEALVPAGEGYKVFVVGADGLAHARPVQVGARAGDVVQIRSGLTAGERVVTYGAYGMEDSARVVQVKP